MNEPVTDEGSRVLVLPLGNARKIVFCTARRAALLFTVLLICIGTAMIVRGAASFLIVEDSLEHAAAIVSLGGKLPFREMEAAKLYREGWAPRVVIVRTAPTAESQALEALQVEKKEEWELSSEVLVRQGVPASAIVVPTQEGIGTLEELQVVYRALQQGAWSREHGVESAEQGARSSDMPVILVTSEYHTRRTRLIWNYVTQGRSRAILRAAHDEPFDPERWWRTRRYALAVVREYLGLLNYYAGFPVTP